MNYSESIGTIFNRSLVSVKEKSSVLYFTEVTSVLRTLLENILSNPGNSKYRILKDSDYVIGILMKEGGSVSSILIHLLYAIGFVKETSMSPNDRTIFVLGVPDVEKIRRALWGIGTIGVAPK